MEHVQKLTRIESEEKTEEALLRSRIDQQSELICILKRRADEYLEKCLQNEKDLENLRKDHDKSVSLCDEEQKKNISLQFRFNELNDGHQKLLKITDELKTKNGDITKECASLQVR